MVQQRSSHTQLPAELLPDSDLSPYDRGVQARRNGLVKRAPLFARSSDAREWARGYDDEQRRVDEAAEWAREHAATVDQWGFV